MTPKLRRWLLQPVPYGLWLGTCLMIGVLFAGGLFLFKSVQSSRVVAAERACQETNNNNRATIRQFHVELERALKRTKDPKQQAQLRSSVQANIRLINAILPVHSDCRAYANRRITGPPPS